MRISHLLALALLATNCSAFSQNYPDKATPIRIVVPFGPGGGADMIARAYARAMNEQAGVTVVVENKAGAEGVIGVESVKTARPDGYTILLGNTSTHVLNVHMLSKAPYDPVQDFTPVSGVAKFALVMNAGPSTKFPVGERGHRGGASVSRKIQFRQRQHQYPPWHGNVRVHGQGQATFGSVQVRRTGHDCPGSGRRSTS